MVSALDTVFGCGGRVDLDSARIFGCFIESRQNNGTQIGVSGSLFRVEFFGVGDFRVLAGAVTDWEEKAARRVILKVDP